MVDGIFRRNHGVSNDALWIWAHKYVCSAQARWLECHLCFFLHQSSSLPLCFGSTGYIDGRETAEAEEPTLYVNCFRNAFLIRINIPRKNFRKVDKNYTMARNPVNSGLHWGLVLNPAIQRLKFLYCSTWLRNGFIVAISSSSPIWRSHFRR